MLLDLIIEGCYDKPIVEASLDRKMGVLQKITMAPVSVQVCPGAVGNRTYRV